MGCEDGGLRPRHLRAPGLGGQKVTVDEALQMGMKVRLWLLDGEEGVVTLTIRDEPVEL